ncbi:MAG: tetracycline regulation of excision RteC [Bacteroidetes bacterium]|nr:tetracycline regulation of excision RteC [Bacteroidota bacterium]
MEKYFNNTIERLEAAINNLEFEADNQLQAIEEVIYLIIEYLFNLKEYVLIRNFRNIDEEIRFFKHLKPRIVAKLIFYNSIYKSIGYKKYGHKKSRT